MHYKNVIIKNVIVRTRVHLQVQICNELAFIEPSFKWKLYKLAVNMDDYHDTHFVEIDTFVLYSR